MALAALCIVGAFLGADRARAMFNSPPLCAFWGLLTLLLIVGIVAWRTPRRSPGLLAVHAGLLLILAGGIWGSRAAHDWRGNFLNSNGVKSAEGYLLLSPHDAENNVSSQLWNLPPNAPPEPTDSLPFEIKVRRAWLEYYPPEELYWTLLGLTYDESGDVKDATQLHGEIALPKKFPAIDGDVTVLKYNHTLRQIELQLTRHGETMTNSITAGPANEPTVLSLADVFDAPRAWRKAGRPGIMLLPPPQTVRDYKAELAILDADGNTETAGDIEINHPLRARGYHFYLATFDPPTALVVKVVSDDGLYWVYTGFALLMLGVVLRLWIEPAFRRGGATA